jgi:predicted nucleotidyltransferase
MDAAAAKTQDRVVERVVARLRTIDGVTGLVLGGSRARGMAEARADVDIGVYYRARQRPDAAVMRAAARDLDDRGEPDGFGEYGEWGPWINGGAWLVVGGFKTDLLFREVDRVEQVLADCEVGRVTCAYQPGHPHCFVNHIYAGELHHNVILFDPDGVLAELRGRTDPYPEPLADELTRSFGWESQFSLQTARTAAWRGDVTYVCGCLFRAVACMAQALFAANRTYLLNEKGAVAAVDRLPRRPDSFSARVTAALGRIGETDAELHEALERVSELQRESAMILAELTHS